MRSRSYGMLLMNRKRASFVMVARTRYRRIACPERAVLSGSRRAARGLLAGLRLDPPDREPLARVLLQALRVCIRVAEEHGHAAGDPGIPLVLLADLIVAVFFE